MSDKKTKTEAKKINRQELFIETSFKNSKGEIISPGEESYLQHLNEKKILQLLDSGKIRYRDYVAGGSTEPAPGKYLEWHSDEEIRAEFFPGRSRIELENLIRAGRNGKLLSISSLLDIRARLIMDPGIGAKALAGLIDRQLKGRGYEEPGAWSFEKSLEEFTEKWEQEKSLKVKEKEFVTV